MNQAALFCDGTGSYVFPAEPEAGSRVTLRFRTARDDSVQVFLLTKGECYAMEKECSRQEFDYYSIRWQLGEESFRYRFMIQDETEVCYYGRCGVSKEIEDKQEIQPSKESKEVENNEDKLEETEIEPVSVVEEPEPAFEDNNDIELVSPIIKDSRYDLYQTTHLAKLALAEDEARIRYNEVKNIIMSYKNMTCRFGKRFESFNVSRDKLFVLSIRNKNVTLYLNLDPSSLDSKYFIEDVSNIRKYASYPSKLVIKSNRGVKYAEELIEQAATKFNIEKKKRKSYVDYLALYPKQTEDELIKSGEMYKRKN